MNRIEPIQRQLLNVPFIDNSMSYYELLSKLMGYINLLIDSANGQDSQIEELKNLYNELSDFLNEYLGSPDFIVRLNEKLDEMSQDGTLATIINQQIFADINQDIADVQTDLSTLSDTVSKISDRKFLFIGDSWATSASVFTTKSWVDYTIENLGLQRGVNAFVSQLGSTGITTSVATPNFGTVDFNKLIDVAPSFDVSLTNKNIITDIVICGGTNDYNKTYSELLTNALIIKNTIKTQYKNVKNVYLGFLGMWIDSTDHRRMLQSVYGYYSTIASKCGFIFIDKAYHATKLYLTNTPVHPDKTIAGWAFHPNDYGSELIANYVSQALIGGSFNFTVPHNQMNITLENEFSLYIPNGGTVPIYSYIEGDTVGVFVYNPFTLYNTNTSGSFVMNGGKVLIGSFTNSCLNPLANRNVSIPTTVSLVNTHANTRVSIPAGLLIEEGKIYVTIYGEPNTFTQDFYIEICQCFGTIPRHLC